MAKPQSRKRQRANECLQEGCPPDDHQAKKPRTKNEITLAAWESWTYPPEFWDRLSKFELTHRALEELNRRTRAQCSPLHPLAHKASTRFPAFATTTCRDLARFARQGGPDLCDLRGYPGPKKAPPAFSVMSSSRSSRSRGTKSADLASTLPTSATTKTRKSTPYNRDFDQHLIDHRIYATYTSQKPDLTQVRAALAVPRPSLSPSKFSDGAFETFQENNARAKNEDDVLANAIPTITGPNKASHPSARNTIFGNLDPITDGTIAPPKPDIYDGAYPEELSRSIRNELRDHIIPSTMEDKPMVPNFFAEVKGPDGSLAVATRQARYDGAIGSRAMYSLQNYGEEEPAYDGKACTFTSIYHGGMLQIYAHHTTAPTTEGGRPGYHMTKVSGFDMTNNRETFVGGATAFRNARDLAKHHRDTFVKAANAKPQAKAPPKSTEVRSQDSTTDEFVNCSVHIPPQDFTTQLTNDVAALSNEPLHLPEHPYNDYDGYDDDSQGASQESAVADLGDPSMSFISSLTSSFTEQSRSKRQLSPQAIHDSSSLPKRRMCPSTRSPNSTSTVTGLKHKVEAGHICDGVPPGGEFVFQRLKEQETETVGTNGWREKQMMVRPMFGGRVPVLDAYSRHLP